jgi:hypothetical protein
MGELFALCSHSGVGKVSLLGRRYVRYISISAQSFVLMYINCPESLSNYICMYGFKMSKTWGYATTLWARDDSSPMLGGKLPGLFYR